MAIFRCTFRSTMLTNDTNLNIILPDRRLRPPKVIYLLHGFQQHFGSWLNQSSVVRYATGKNLAIVMPDGGRSFYSDMTTGEHYYSYITKELPHFLKTQFNLDPAPKDTAVAGLSMGGYGAFKIGMRNPDRYKTICAFSPACDIVQIAEDNPLLTHAICGDMELRNSEHDLYHLARELSKAENKPKILHYCGDNDFMIKENHDFRDFMFSLPLDYTYTEDKGAHEWPLWDKWIEDFIGKFMAE
ncbi:MAG: alpha/beta hydrolase [Clostridia bacterium]